MEPDRKLLEILVCPVTKGQLRLDREKQELISPQAGLAFPIRNGIPIPYRHRLPAAPRAAPIKRPVSQMMRHNLNVTASPLKIPAR